jgi:hypothetical protein
MLRGGGLWRVSSEPDRDGALAEVLAVEFEEQPVGVERCGRLVVSSVETPIVTAVMRRKSVSRSISLKTIA